MPGRETVKFNIVLDNGLVQLIRVTQDRARKYRVFRILETIMEEEERGYVNENRHILGENPVNKAGCELPMLEPISNVVGIESGGGIKKLPFNYVASAPQLSEIEQNPSVDSIWEDIPLHEYLKIVNGTSVAVEIGEDEDNTSKSSENSLKRIIFAILIRIVFTLGCLVGDIRLDDFIREMVYMEKDYAEAGEEAEEMLNDKQTTSTYGSDLDHFMASQDTGSYETAIDVPQTVVTFADQPEFIPPTSGYNAHNSAPANHPVPPPNSTVDFLALITACAVVMSMLGIFLLLK